MSLAAGPIARTTDTLRFTLRPLEASDESLYREIYIDAETMRHIGRPLSVSEAMCSFRAAVKQTADLRSTTRIVVVVDNATRAEVGICGAALGVPRLGSVEAGIVLKRDARNRGLSRPIFKDFVEYLFTSSGAVQVQVRYAAANTAMRHLAQSLAFVPCEGPTDGANVDLLSWAVVSRDRWGAFCATN